MPVYDTVGGASSGGGAGQSVSIDADGYMVIGDGTTILPFKTVTTEIVTGVYRFTRMIKHPVLGQVELEVTDVAVS